jgi:hypothetical protein
MSMKNSNDIIGNRTRTFPACSAVPQATAPPRAPGKMSLTIYIDLSNFSCSFFLLDI